MNQYDLDRQLNLAIDALNREASPAPYEQGDADIFSLVDTARLARSLRAPAEPDADFAELAVDRIAADLRQAAASGNDIPPAASTPVIHALPVEEPADERPRGFRNWLNRYSELAAILLVGFIVLGGIFVYQTILSGDDGAPAIGVNETDGSFDLYLLLGERQLQPLNTATLENLDDAEILELHPWSWIDQSADGSTVATIEYGSRVLPTDPNLEPDEVTIVITNGLTGTERARFHPPEHVHRPVLSNDGRRLLVQSRAELTTDDISVWHIFDTSDGRLIGSVARESPNGYDAMFFGADTNRLYRASSTSSGDINVSGNLVVIAYDVASGAEIDRLELTAIPVGRWNGEPERGPATEHFLEPAITLSQDETTFAVVHGHEDTITLIDAETLTVSATLAYAPGDASIEHWFDRELPSEGPTAASISRFATFSPDGRYLYIHGAGTGLDTTHQQLVHGFGLVVVDLHGGETVAAEFENDQVMQIVPDPDGHTLYVSINGQGDDAEQRILRLDARTFEVLAERTLDQHRHIILDAVPGDRMPWS